MVGAVLRGGRRQCRIAAWLVGCVLVCVYFGAAAAQPCDQPWKTDKCMETEKIVIDGQRRLIAFCQVRDTYPAGTPPNERSDRSGGIIGDHVYNPVTGGIVAAQETSVRVFKRKQAIFECPFDEFALRIRNEDFVDQIQAALQTSAMHCAAVSKTICKLMGGNTSSLSTLSIPNEQCCALENLQDAWTITNPRIFRAWCGSGYRQGNEDCDDGNLDEDVDLGAGHQDGCTAFCRIPRENGWDCYTPPDDEEGRPQPDVCTCNCDCNRKCTCQDAETRRFCSVSNFGTLPDGTVCCV